MASFLCANQAALSRNCRSKQILLLPALRLHFIVNCLAITFELKSYFPSVPRTASSLGRLFFMLALSMFINGLTILRRLHIFSQKLTPPSEVSVLQPIGFVCRFSTVSLDLLPFSFRLYYLPLCSHNTNMARCVLAKFMNKII